MSNDRISEGNDHLEGNHALCWNRLERWGHTEENHIYPLISDFHRDLNIENVLLGISPASNCSCRTPNYSPQKQVTQIASSERPLK